MIWSKGLFCAGKRGGTAVLVGGFSCLAWSCNRPFARGAEVVALDDLPTASVVAAYEMGSCQDRAGNAARRDARVSLLETKAKELKLLETRAGHDLLLVSNHFEHFGERVFQGVLQAGKTPVLLDYRLPKSPDQPGRMAVIRSWEEIALGREGFRGYFQQADLICALLPLPTVRRDMARRHAAVNPGEP